MSTNCPDDTRKSLYLDRELPASEIEAIESHRRACPRCDRELGLLEGLERLLAPSRDESLPPDLLARLRSVPDHRSRNGLPWLIGGAAAAALILVAVLLGGRDPHRTVPEPPPSVRDRVLAALANPGPASEAVLDELGDSALVVLHRIANGEDAGAARAAIARLGALGRRESLPTLLLATKRQDLRDPAVRALAELGDRRAMPALEALIEAGAPDHLVLRAAARIGGREAVRLLGKRIRASAGRPEVPQFVLLLAGMGGAEAARELLTLSDDPLVRVHTVRALALERENLLPEVLRLARRGDLRVGERAVAVLGRLGPRGSVPVLEELLGNRRLRRTAARALARIDTAAAAEALSRHLVRPEVRRAFAAAGPGIEAWLIARLYGRYLPTRQDAIALLGLCGRDRAVRALAPLASEPRLAPRVFAALSRIGGEVAVAALDALADDHRLRRAATGALAETGHPAAARALAKRGLAVTGLRAGDPAIRALARMDPGLVAPVLTAMVEGSGGERAERLLRTLSLAPRRVGSPRPPLD